jgi:hypothetical protein
MRVSSPIGDLPFEVTTVRREGRELVVEGLLGTWPSRIHIGVADVRMLARALRVPLAVGASAAVAAVVIRSGRR